MRQLDAVGGEMTKVVVIVAIELQEAEMVVTILTLRSQETGLVPYGSDFVAVPSNLAFVARCLGCANVHSKSTSPKRLIACRLLGLGPGQGLLKRPSVGSGPPTSG